MVVISVVDNTAGDLEEEEGWSNMGLTDALGKMLQSRDRSITREGMHRFPADA